MKTNRNYIRTLVALLLFGINTSSFATIQPQKERKKQKTVTARITGLSYGKTTNTGKYEQVAVELRIGKKTVTLDKTVNGAILDRSLPQEYALGKKIKVYKNPQIRDHDTIGPNAVAHDPGTISLPVTGLMYGETISNDQREGRYEQIGVVVSYGDKEFIVEKTIDGKEKMDRRLTGEYAMGEYVILQLSSQELDAMKAYDTIHSDKVAVSRRIYSR